MWAGKSGKLMWDVFIWRKRFGMGLPTDWNVGGGTFLIKEGGGITIGLYKYNIYILGANICNLTVTNGKDFLLKKFDSFL